MKKTSLLLALFSIIVLSESFCFSQKEGVKPQIKSLSQEFIFDSASFPSCHASSIVETKEGLLIAFFGGKYERSPDVSIYTSRRIGQQWTTPCKLADGLINDTLSYPTWNPVLFNAGDSLFLFYKVGPNPTSWWGLFKYSIDQGKTWSVEQRLAEGILGPIRNKPIKLKSGIVLSPSSTESSTGIWKAHIERSTDNGRTWTRTEIPSDNKIKVIQPTLLAHPDGKIQALLRSDQNVIMQSWSHDEGLTWSEISPTDVTHPNAGIDAIRTQSGLFLLVNNPLKRGESWEVGRNKLTLYWSVDGFNWQFLMELENEPTGEFSYPAIIQSEDGYIHITYTYNRKKIKHVSFLINNTDKK